MTGRDPLEQVEDFLTEVETHIAAEQIKTQAEMILVTALTGKPVLQGQLLADVQEQGPEHVSGMLVALGLTARNWGHVLGDNPDIDFAAYLLDTNCGSTADNFAHYVARKILGIQDVRLADEVRREMHEFFHEATPVEWGRFTVHLIHLFRELVDGVLDIKNGDYHGEST